MSDVFVRPLVISVPEIKDHHEIEKKHLVGVPAWEVIFSRKNNFLQKTYNPSILRLKRQENWLELFFVKIDYVLGIRKIGLS